MTAKGATRSVDPQRRSRIIEATVEVLHTHGLEGLTHRRVAAAAGVPLGSTSYYFASKEDLLAAAFAETARRDLDAMERQMNALPADASLAEAMAKSLCDRVNLDRQPSIISFELYAAALRREGVRDLAVAWDQAWIDALAPRVGPLAAKAVVAAAVGLLQRAILVGGSPSLEETTAIMRYVLHEESA